jgi:exopolysaccharide production protein ExoQ
VSTVIISAQTTVELPVAHMSYERLVSALLLGLLLLFLSTDGIRVLDGRMNEQGLLMITPTAGDVIGGRVQTAALASAMSFLLLLSFNSVLAIARRMMLLTLLSALPVFSVLWSGAVPATLHRGILVLLSSLLGFHFACHYSSRKQIRIFLCVGAIAALASCIFALLLPKLGLDHTVHEGAWRGIFTHKNLCAFGMVLFISPLFGSEERSTTLPKIAYASVVLLVLGMTQSRGGWVVFFMYVAAMCTLKGLGKFKRRDSRSLAVMGVLLLAIAGGLIYQNLASILGLLGRDITLSGRTDIWQAVFESIMRKPLLGYGYGAFWTGLQGESANVILACGWMVPHAHNGFLEVWLQLGLLGLSLLIATLVLAIRDFLVCFTPDRPRAVDWYAGMLIIILLDNFAEPSLVTERSIAWVLYVTACVGLRRYAMAARTLRHGKQHSCPVAERDLGAADANLNVAAALTSVGAAVRSVQ